MPQIFRPRANALARSAIIGSVAAVAALGVIAYAYAYSSYSLGRQTTPEQPVPFSHKHHVGGLGIDCGYCHTSFADSGFAGIPSTHTCMTCHSQLWTSAEMLEPVRASLALEQPLRWRRVHDLADYVYFNHRVHVTNGIGCETCHGRVDQMPLMSQHAPLTMGWCLACHRDPAPHLRPSDEITTMGYNPGKKTLPPAALMAHYDIALEGLTDCVTCHR